MTLPLTLSEHVVARTLGITRQRLARMRHDGAPPGSLGVRIGGRIQYDSQTLIRWYQDLYGSPAGQHLIQAIIVVLEGGGG